MLIGLVGKPNVGKSTFFKAATLSDILIANYPFATIKPNHAIGYVKIDDLAAKFGKVSNPREGYVKKGFRFVPVEIYDVAGLVEGASEGKGLGNEFLNDLTAVDALIHVVDVSGETDSGGKPLPSAEHYPGEDIKFVEKELDLWYMAIFQKVWTKFVREIEMKKTDFEKSVASQFSGLKVKEEHVREAVKNAKLNSEKPSSWNSEDLLHFSSCLRKASKPMIIAANKCDRPMSKDNIDKIKKEFNYLIVPCFADGELALREADKHGLIDYVPGSSGFEIVSDLNDKQRSALEAINDKIKIYGSTGVQEILNKVVFEMLNYIAVFPAGEKLADKDGNVLPDCYLMPPNSTALDFAYRIHSTIGDRFVKAIRIKDKRPVGKDYKLENLDGIEILTK